MRRTQPTAIALLAWLGLSGLTLSPSLVPREDIVAGGPPKDGIPALTDPVVEPAAAAGRWLRPEDRVLGVVVNGQARAYPIRILNWHEIVNDKLGGKRIVVTYCPLCGSGMVFASNDRFGVSGLLYQSDVLLYDHKTESLWSQIKAMAITGARMGERLQPLPLLHTNWKAWRRLHPETDVLSRRTGHRRDYSRDPYAGYAFSSALFFPVDHHDSRLPPKTWVVGLELAGKARAWALKDLAVHGDVRETWQGRRLWLRYQQAGNHVEIIDVASGKALPAITLYWFAWAAFHPDSELYTP